MNPFVVAIVAIPAILAMLSLVVPSRIGRPLTAVGSLLTATCIGILAFGAAHGASGLDDLSTLFLLPVALVYGTVGLYMVWYVKAEGEHNGKMFRRELLALTNALACIELLVPLLVNLAALWLAVEVTTLVAALFIRLQGTPGALEAAWKYMLIASCALAMGLIGIVVLYASATATLGPHHNPTWASYIEIAHKLKPDAVRIAFILVLVGFGTKMGLVPMHTWLPDAHSAGPTPTSAMLSGILLSDALYVLLRFTAIANAAVGPVFAQHLFLLVGLLSLFLGAFALLQQRDIKRMLAYSSIEHMGIIATGLSFGTPLALGGALLHVVNHSASKTLAFYSAGRLSEHFDTREISGIRGAVATLPFSGTLFALAGLSLAGLPPFGIFRSELMILAGGFQSTGWPWALLMLALLIVAFAGIVRWVSATSTGPLPENMTRGERSVAAVVAMLLAFAIVLAIGLAVPRSLGTLIDGAMREINGTQ
jgi:hydrogenase-4 component F